MCLRGAHGRQPFVHLAALWAIPDDLADSLLDADPVVEFCNGRRRLVDAAVALVVHVACNLVLALRIGNDFFPLKPELLRLVVGPWCQLVVGGRRAQAAFLCAVGSVWVFAVLQVEADLVEALFRHKVVVLPQIAPVYDGIDKLAGIRLEIAAALDAPNALEAQRIPYPARCEVGFVDEVEDGVSVALRMLEHNVNRTLRHAYQLRRPI